jgi:phosphoribosylamine--glycine ligase
VKILFVSIELIGSALIHRLLDEGHDVRLYIDDLACKHCLDGFVEKTSDWKAELRWVGRDGLIIFDDVGWNGAQNQLRKDGYRVVGGDSESDRLELDRNYFREALTACGVPTLQSHDFQSAQEAREFIEANPDRWVLKQSSHMSTATYVGRRDDGRDVLELLHIYEDRNICPIHLQQTVDGIEIGVARYFNGHDWIGPIEVNIEHKALFPGGIGPLTCEMGTLVWYDENESLPLFVETLGKLREHLRSIAYKGDIDINCMVNEDGIWPLEATTRFGSPATQVQCELHLSEWGDFLSAIADGTPFNLEYHKGFSVGVTIAMPPYPFGMEFMADYVPGSSERTKVFIDSSLNEFDLRKIHFEEATLENTDLERIVHYRGGCGYAAVVTGSGASPEQAQSDAYRMVSAIHIPRSFHRNDIGDRFIREDWDTLRELGVI